MSNSEGTDSNYLGSASSFTTTYTHELDFVETDFVAPSVLSRIASILRKAGLAVWLGLAGTVKLSLEVVRFLIFLLVYCERKVISFVYFLERAKDTFVGLLMWRRGLLFRPTTHGGLLVISSVALLVGSLFRTGVAPTNFTRDSVLAATNTPETIIPTDRPRSEIVNYTVKEGDSVSAIASTFGVSVDSIKWLNDLESIDAIKPGTTLAIPPVSGVIHKVKEGDSLAKIAETYKADPQTIVDYPFNYIDDSLHIVTGQLLIVPGGVKPAPKPVRRILPAPVFLAGSGLFSWPLPMGSVSQYPSWWHPAVDVAAPYGTGVYASASGTVITASYSRYGYGNLIVIDHGNGYQSLYAHLSAINVSVGQGVSQGQLVGAVGCTGRCTGSHLHFGISQGDTALNPLSFFH